MRKIQRGFTLTEVLIVVAIIGLLATLVIPRFSSQGERGVVAEAVGMLTALRQAEAAYQLENAAYTATLSSLDVDVTVNRFTYACTVAGQCTATRSGGGTTFSGTTIILAINGTWSGTHPLRPT